MATKKIILTKTVVYKGKHHRPDSVHEWPVKIVNEIIEKNAGDPVLDVVGTSNPKKEDETEDNRTKEDQTEDNLKG
ncbi:MAG: hypothetical protein GY710_17325 [Desulfobacteraceae bacterium]|nr:hypothetical protein [Desulfobacteraceae bacterium]